MGAESDEEARRRRAARLREDVRATVEAEKPGSGRRGAPSVRPRSPRDFVHERMRELDRAAKKESKG
jgi:hypothetical protein